MEPTPHTDPQANADQRQAFSELVIAHQTRVRNYVRSIGVCSSAVDDIAQEAFVVAYKRFDSYEPETSFPAWVCTIARNLVWNDRRKASRRQEILDTTVTEVLVSIDPYEQVVQQEDHAWQLTALRHCMEKIPEKNRELVEMRYKHEIEPTEIARQMGAEAGAIRLRLMRIRQTLYECIKQRIGGSNAT